MIAHYHAQTWNSSELARAFGVAHTTVQRYLDLLTETFMVRQLPRGTRTSKRQVRAPKVYLRDTGLLHTLLGIH
jgi:predicted AAA+ superfamily ATPase